jgi:hypothetical protein
MGCFGCSDGSGSETEEVIDNPRIDPRARNAANAQGSVGLSDRRTNAPDTFPERLERVNTATDSLPLGVRVIRNERGGVQIFGPVDGDVFFGDEEVVIERHGQRFVLPRRGGRTQAPARETGSHQRERRGSTDPNFPPGRLTGGGQGADTSRVESSSLEGSSAGPDLSTGSNRNLENQQGDGGSDVESDADTLVEGDGTRGSRSHRRGPDGFLSGRSSRRPGRGNRNFRSPRSDLRGSSVQINSISSGGTWNQINSFTTNSIGSGGTWNQINSFSSGGTSNVQINSGRIANQFNSPHQINYAGSGFQINGVISNFHGDSGKFAFRSFECHDSQHQRRTKPPGSWTLQIVCRICALLMSSYVLSPCNICYKNVLHTTAFRYKFSPGGFKPA